MEEAELTPEYLKRFNEGYLLQKYMPDLSEKIADAAKDLISTNGFLDGRNQFIHELERERYPAWLREDKIITPDTYDDKAKEVDKDDIEPEKE